MKGAYIDGTIRAEIKRAWKTGQAIDRLHLYEETGLTWNQLERRISVVTMEAVAELAKPKGAR